MLTVVSIYSKHDGCVLRLLNRIRETLSKELWLFMFEMHVISGITDGGRGGNRPPSAKLNVKTGTLSSLYFSIFYSFGFSSLLFFAFFGVFFGDFGFLYCR